MSMAAQSSNDLELLLVLHYLKGREYHESARALERETQIWFNMDYFVSQIKEGMFDKAEEYLYAFTNVNDNLNSARTIYLLKQLKLLEALYDGSKMYAKTIVEIEFPQFNGINQRIIEGANELLALEDPRTHPMLRTFDREDSRKHVAEEVKKCIRENPVFRGKLEFPTFRASLQRLVNLLVVTNEPNGTVISLLPSSYRNEKTATKRDHPIYSFMLHASDSVFSDVSLCTVEMDGSFLFHVST